jgi:hypothetical protein
MDIREWRMKMKTRDNDDHDGEDHVEDPEQIVQSRRLESIFDIRDELREYRKIILIESYDDYGMSRFQALSGYRTLANNYLMEIQPLLEKYESGKELLTEHDFGPARVEPQYHAINHGQYEITHHDERQTTTVESAPYNPTARFELEGLEAIWNTPDPLRATFNVKQYDNRNKTIANRSIEITDQFSVETTDKFIRSMNRFLSEIGFELEPTQTKEDVHFDYSDLI